ncbi:unnamed protein product [Darwinula stevensoni]|uniref:RRM domain-containing protein n=1 Tax=Darwinula stevensoni TaxID=69355 RepID=A0A7R9FPT1_9CRUS|nr:unnamed protein product [Darwinula stevensoni]CAG0898391.1 unnamed protein product [Darwinula stevensoni]
MFNVRHSKCESEYEFVPLSPFVSDGVGSPPLPREDLASFPDSFCVAERKLFVGMLSKKCNENDVRAMFSPYGQIEECTVLRDANGHSKGCAFVTFTTRQSAFNAIKNIHHSMTMEVRRFASVFFRLVGLRCGAGCSSPLVVKFADTQKEKDQKKMMAMKQSLWNMGNMNMGSLTPQYLSLLQSVAALAAQQQQSTQQATNPPGGMAAAANAAAAAAGLTPLQLQQLLAATSNTAASQGLAGLAGLGGNPNMNSSSPTDNSPSLQSLAALANLSAGSGSGSSMSPALGAAAAAAMANAVNGLGSCTSPASSDHLTSPYSYASANLFIYHLPQEFGDADLAQTFLPFGNVISAKVFIDKQTNLSKCFGFVSYDNPLSAQAAIQAMNGFQIGTKRLKVQLKRSKDASKPY